VAPDHPEVKSVMNDFDAVAKDPRFTYCGGVTVGEDVQLADVSAAYDGVVLAYGASSDRALGVPGESLRGVMSARTFVNWYNGHPAAVNEGPDLSRIRHVVIVGQGNVAIDCARVLVKSPAELADTDITAAAAAALARSSVQRVTVIGRRGHVQASFTMKELREVTKLAEADLVLRPAELQAGRTAASVAEMEAARAKKRMDALLTEAAAATASAAPKKRSLELRFLLSPVACLPSPDDPSRVGAMQCAVNRLEGPAGEQAAVSTGATETIPADLVLRSIGYRSLPIPGLPFDAKKAVVPNVGGRVASAPPAAGGAPPSIVPRLYVAGWLKRGPSGIIGTNIPDARETVAAVVDDIAKGIIAPSATAGPAAIVAKAAARGGKAVTWHGYEAIAAAETSRGAAAGKPREKVTSIPEMVSIAATAQGGLW